MHPKPEEEGGIALRFLSFFAPAVCVVFLVQPVVSG